MIDQSSRKKLSVLIPAYNCETTIGRAIQSVLKQSYREFELIIVDDGSGDETLKVIRSIEDARIKIIQHPTNLGEAEARNTAVNSASGSFLAFLDSDDEWLPEKLALQMGILQMGILQIKPEVIKANVSGFFLYDEFNIRRMEIPAQPKSWTKHLLMGCGLGPGTTLVVSRAAFQEIGYYDPSLPRYTDWDWLLRYTKLYSLSVTPEPLAIIHRTSRPQAKVVEKAAKQFLEKHLQEFQQFGHYGKRAVGKRYLEVAIHYFLEGDKVSGKEWFRKAMQQSIFQRPGMYLRILDSLLGTEIMPAIIRFRARR